MSKKNHNPDQLELSLFGDSVQIPKIITQEDVILANPPSVASVTDKEDDDFSESQIYQENLNKRNNINLESQSHKTDNLFLPFTYEEILKEIGEKKARLPDLIVPVTKFEEQIIQVLADIRNAGYLLFLYGVSGVGKSTFISSLQFQKYIPIKEIVSINASELIQEDNSGLKLKELIKRIKEESIQFFSKNNKTNENLCIVIDYLENLKDEDKNHVRAFFRDLNGLLRKYEILIIWPVTEREDLENMQNFAESVSSTIFHRRIPIINFTGPPIDEYPNIAKKTILVFNEGQSCYNFQLNDHDFEELKTSYQQKPQEKHLIREYLKDVRGLWEKRTKHISKIVKSIPKPTEVWFIFSYPKAEDVVARFAKQTPDIIDEMWNADYKSLFAYIGNNQREADWKPQRLTLALSSRMLTTKIMYLPTNALVSCIAAYVKESKIPITREELIHFEFEKDEKGNEVKDEEGNKKKIGKYVVPEHWFGKKRAKDTLQTTPLYLQLLSITTRPGFRSSGAVPTALKNAKQAFEQFNEDISTKIISDQRFNHAICLALQNVLSDQPGFNVQHEKKHPNLENIRPDILVDTDKKLICLEFCYTNNNTPGYLANYVLTKLNKYMKQLEDNFGIPEDFSW